MNYHRFVPCYSHRTLNDGFKCAKSVFTPCLRGFNDVFSVGLTEKVARHMTKKTVNALSLVPCHVVTVHKGERGSTCISAPG